MHNQEQKNIRAKEQKVLLIHDSASPTLIPLAKTLLTKPRRGAVVVISQRLADAKPPFLPNRAGRRWCASAYAATSKIIALQAIAAVYRGVRRYGGTASAVAVNSLVCKG